MSNPERKNIGDLDARLKQRRADAVKQVEDGQKVIREIDAAYERMAELAGSTSLAPAPASAEPKPASSKKASFFEPPRGFGIEEDGTPAKTVAVLKKRAGTPMKASEILDVIAPGITGEKRKKLDELVRSALSKAIRNPASGIRRASYGRYVWGEPVNGAVSTSSRVVGFDDGEERHA